MNGRATHQAATFVLSAAMVVIGVALVVQALAGGASGVAFRLLLGVLFVAGGVGRTYLELRRRRGA
jgi:hypothetical protein